LLLAGIQHGQTIGPGMPLGWVHAQSIRCVAGRQVFLWSSEGLFNLNLARSSEFFSFAENQRDRLISRTIVCAVRRNSSSRTGLVIQILPSSGRLSGPTLTMPRFPELSCRSPASDFLFEQSSCLPDQKWRPSKKFNSPGNELEVC